MPTPGVIDAPVKLRSVTENDSSLKEAALCAGAHGGHPRHGAGIAQGGGSGAGVPCRRRDEDAGIGGKEKCYFIRAR